MDGLTRRGFGGMAIAAALAAAAHGSRAQTTGAPIKIGILHSLSGTMAISETTLKDVMLMLVDLQNARAACSATSSRRWWSTRRPTGRSSPKRRAS